MTVRKCANRGAFCNPVPRFCCNSKTYLNMMHKIRLIDYRKYLFSRNALQNKRVE